MHRVHLIIGLSAALAACDGDNGTSVGPDRVTTGVSVTVASPIRMGATTQAAGIATFANQQTQPVTTGWLSDATGVATVSDAGLVTGVANGRATIYVISGGVQGQQVIRVVPDYQGSWSGGLRVTSCTQTGDWASEDIDFCQEFPVGSTWQYSLSLAQSGESMTATLSEGSPLAFPAAPAPIGGDGSSSFSSTFVETSVGLSIEVTGLINSLRVGELTGTINEIWRAPGVSGEGRLAQEIVGTTRTSTSALGLGVGGSSGKLRLLRRFAIGRR